MKQNDDRAGQFIGPTLGLLALFVYSFTLSIGAYPGRSADLIVQHMGLIPRMTPDNPAWSAVVWFVLKLLPLGSPVFRMNFLSALCGAGSVWLLYELVSGVVCSVLKEGATDVPVAMTASRLAGVSAAMFLTFCIPFWIVSNRAHVGSFDILLLLLCSWFLMRYAMRHEEMMGACCAFVLGLGVAEFATFIIFAPFFAVFLVVLLWRHERLCLSAVAKFAALVLAGLSFYFFAAWAFYQSKGYELRGYSGFFQVMWQMWRSQYFLIARSLPKEGWLIILVVTLVPWLTCLLVKFRALNGPRDVTYLFLHVVITGCAVIVLLNLKLSPWRRMGAGNLLVTPYVLMASVYGYLTAYWYMFPRVWWGDREHGTRAAFVGPAGLAMVVPAFVLLVVAPFRNIEEADGRPAGLIKHMAEQTIMSMSGRTWLVTDGAMDEQLLVAGKGQVRLLNMSRGNEEIYMKYVADSFDGPRLKNLARIGMVPLLQEWLASDPEIGDKLAVQTMPDLLVSGNLTVVPNRLVFLAVRNPDMLRPAEIMTGHEHFWETTVPFVRESSDPEGRLAFFGRHFLRHMSLVANNLGVLMEDVGRDEDAFSAYSRAREIDANNVSALLNQITMLKKGFGAAGQADKFKSELQELLAGIETRYHIWSLSQYYGYVRSPGAFASLGLTWAHSGQARAAISTMKKAMELLPESERTGLKQRMAAVYLISDRPDESEALYFELLVEDPENVQALAGLARISTGRKEFSKARELLTRVQKTGAPEHLMAFEWALLYQASGDTDRARSALERLVDFRPQFREAWVMLMDLIFQQNDQKAMAKTVRKLRDLEGDHDPYLLPVAEGKLAMMQNDWQQATQEFEKALRTVPAKQRSVPLDTHLLETLANLAMAQDDEPAMISYVRKLLMLDQGNARANYIMGCIQMANGHRELAEDSFLRSVETLKTPNALNNLAWLLQDRGEFVAAEQYILEALGLNSDMFQLWDTLGVILMKSGRFDEAENAIDRSLSINPDDLNALLHMAEIQALKGNKAQALELVDMLARKQQSLSSSDQSKLYDIRQMAKKLP